MQKSIQFHQYPKEIPQLSSHYCQSLRLKNFKRYDRKCNLKTFLQKGWTLQTQGGSKLLPEYQNKTLLWYHRNKAGCVLTENGKCHHHFQQVQIIKCGNFGERFGSCFLKKNPKNIHRGLSKSTVTQCADLSLPVLAQMWPKFWQLSVGISFLQIV